MTCIAAGVLLAAAACKGGETPAAGTADSTARAAANSAPPAAADSTMSVPAGATLASYRLTTGNIAKVAKVLKTIKAMEQKDPSLRAQWEHPSSQTNPKTIDDLVVRVRNAPHAPEVLQSAGISAHDYVYTSFALMYAEVAYHMKKAGRPLTTGQFATQVNPANVEFVANHLTELKALGAISQPSSAKSHE